MQENENNSSENNEGNLIERISSLLQKVNPNSWNAGFLTSIKEQFVKNNKLSLKQIQMFEKIEAEQAETPEKIEFKNQWNKNPEMRERTIVVARIYQKLNEKNITRYFNDLVHTLLNSENYIPTKEEYEKLVHNDYAVGYWNNYICQPKFSVGDTVELSATVKNDRQYRYAFEFFDKAIVLSNDKVLPATHGKGGKLYIILPYGKTKPIEIAEGFIKFAKGSKKKKSQD